MKAGCLTLTGELETDCCTFPTGASTTLDFLFSNTVCANCCESICCAAFFETARHHRIGKRWTNPAHLDCFGIVRASYRSASESSAILEPNKNYQFEIDLWATSNVFLPGHRIRVEISSSDFPRFDRNANTERQQFFSRPTVPIMLGGQVQDLVSGVSNPHLSILVDGEVRINGVHAH